MGIVTGPPFHSNIAVSCQSVIVDYFTKNFDALITLGKKQLDGKQMVDFLTYSFPQP